VTISSRTNFHAALQDATVRTDQLIVKTHGWPLLDSVRAQLAFIEQRTANGRTPSREERLQTTLAPLAARNFDDDPAYADRLQELDYVFRRYDMLPAEQPTPARGILQVWSGPESYRKLVFKPGDRRTVGAAAPADLHVNKDPKLASPHFELTWDGLVAHVSASSSEHEMSVAGLTAWRGEMSNRGWMTAGRTNFRFFVEGHTPPPAPRPESDAQRAALAILRPIRDQGTLYAVIDAARSERALGLLEESIDPYMSLYDGPQGRTFEDIAPYLVHLSPNSDLLGRLVHEGWGESWGIYLDSRAGFDTVRRHLRQFLKVEVEGAADPVFFRFYDPRVLRTFVTTISAEQHADLVAGLDRLLYEGDDLSTRVYPSK